MAGKIHLVCCAEGLNDLRSNTNIPDAPLSQRGWYDAEDMGRRFIKENPNTIRGFFTSPLRRAIQTTLRAFDSLIQGTTASKKVPWTRVPIFFDPELQEIDDTPSNTGSDNITLCHQFPKLAMDIDNDMDSNWYIKSGPRCCLAGPGQRAGCILLNLNNIREEMEADNQGEWTGEERDIVVVTHPGIISILAPGVDIPMGQWKTFTLEGSDADDFSLRLIPRAD